MVNISDIVPTVSFYDEYEFVELSSLLDVQCQLIDVTPVENDKGAGVAAVVVAEGLSDEPVKIITHSIGVTAAFTHEGVADALKNGPVDFILRQRKSNKTGNKYFYVE